MLSSKSPAAQTTCSDGSSIRTRRELNTDPEESLGCISSRCRSLMSCITIPALQAQSRAKSALATHGGSGCPSCKCSQKCLPFGRPSALLAFQFLLWLLISSHLWGFEFRTHVPQLHSFSDAVLPPRVSSNSKGSPASGEVTLLAPGHLSGRRRPGGRGTGQLTHELQATGPWFG